ncbi:bacteriocin fulvocin C-related protein [Candidatus Palauibacter sp.]|uniref:bacteriocin fulvocin C-related protein n=1 Tax=Candidatus Palauibacter sp. TaxID=3101350 RepID=UPI003B01410F
MKTGWLGLCSAAVVGVGMSGVPKMSDPEEYRDPGGVCATADPVAWFAENIDSSTLTYGRFIEYSPAERSVIARRGSEDLRSMLRDEHLARAAQDDRFSSEQKEVIEHVRAWYKQSAADRPALAAQELERAVSRLFDREEVWFAFRLLGSSDLPAAGLPPADVIPDAGGSSWWCSCGGISDCVSPDDLASRCRWAFCIPNIGCGPDNRFWCTGHCR